MRCVTFQGFRGRGEGRGRRKTWGAPCPRPLAPRGSVLLVRPPSRRRPISLLGVSAGALHGRSVLSRRHFPPDLERDALWTPVLAVVVGKLRASRFPVRLAEQSFGFSCVPNVLEFHSNVPDGGLLPFIVLCARCVPSVEKSMLFSCGKFSVFFL